MNDANGPKLLSLLGPSDSGKTTLAARLVSCWRERGLDVGYVKHASHGFQMDRPGKDTERLTRAGASGVAVTGPEGTAYLEPTTDVDVRAIVRRFFAGTHVVILEGFRTSALPAVVLTGGTEADEALATAQGEVLAVVTPDAASVPAGVPRFAPGAHDALVAHLDAALDLSRADVDRQHA